ncbi:MAG: flagellar biosynthetic protein FliQ [Pseudomonadota bacterium]
MDTTMVIALMREAAWTALVISGPVLTVALVTGLAIGLLQALTSIQELTLTFVPKLVAIVVTFVATLTFMTNGLLRLFGEVILPQIAAI